MKRVLRISSWASLPPGAEADVSFVPPLVRRRLSPLQKLFFSLARSVGAEPPLPVVFASRDGEDALTRWIVAEFNEAGAVSPNRFSSSVYNAAPGLWSVMTKNRAPYTAIAAGDDSVECGFLELLFAGAPAAFVYAEETGGGYGVALRVAPSGEEGRAVEVADGYPSRPAFGFDALCAFLSGASSSLEGKWLSLRDA